MVVVEIGSMGKKYYLHKSLLVFHSEYFRKALQGSWKEAKEGIVRIDDIEPAECTFKIFTLRVEPGRQIVVNVFVHWLYTQHFPSKDQIAEWNHIMETFDNEESTSRTALVVIKAYTLGDRLLAIPFRC